MGKTTLPATVDAVKRFLATATDLREVSRLHDLAEAARRYADSHEAQNFAAEVKLRAARRGGEMLAEVERSPGGRPAKNSCRDGTSFQRALRDAKLAERTAHRWQKLFGLAVNTFERWLAQMKAEGGELTMAAALKIGAHVGQNTGFAEWYTPSEIIEAARTVMGGIDLDPASSEEAQRIIKAKRYYTIEDDGLAKRWVGRVWLNPPYEQPAIQQFTEKLLGEHQAKRVSTAITLTNNATETAWGQMLLSIAQAVCFPDGRVQFWSPDKKNAAPLQGQMICYFGKRAPAFLGGFGMMGQIFTRWQTKTKS